MGPFAELYYEYSTGRNLMVFDKDHDTTEGSRLRIASSSPGSGHMALLRLLCTVGGDQVKLNGVQKSQLAWGEGVEAGREQSCIGKIVDIRGLSHKSDARD